VTGPARGIAPGQQINAGSGAFFRMSGDSAPAPRAALLPDPVEASPPHGRSSSVIPHDRMCCDRTDADRGQAP
jgi:hypothetical protein